MNRNRLKGTSLRLLACICLLLAYGCGTKLPETAKVSGNVTFQGQPVATGRIMFQPDNGRPAVGTIRPDGTYRLTTFQPDDGAVLGKHRVTIEALEATEAPTDATPRSFAEEVAGKGRPVSAAVKASLRWIVPQKYARRDSSPLTAEVKPGTNVLDFNLP